MNPFERLLAQIEEWDRASGNLAKKRFGELEGVERWEPIRRALKVFLDADEILASKEHTDLLIDALWEYFFQLDRSWSGNNTPEKFDESHFSHLRTHGLLYESISGGVRRLSESEVETLVETLESLQEEIRDLGQGLGPAGARFLLLVDSCLTLLTDEDADPEVVRAKAEQLVGAAAAMDSFIPADRREGFWAKVRNVMNPWMGNASSGAAGNMLADIFRHGELTSGS